MSTLQKQVILSLDGLSDDNLQFLLDIIQRFMKPGENRKAEEEKTANEGNAVYRIGCAEGVKLIEDDYDIDDCNGEIAEMFGVTDL